VVVEHYSLLGRRTPSSCGSSAPHLGARGGLAADTTTPAARVEEGASAALEGPVWRHWDKRRWWGSDQGRWRRNHRGEGRSPTEGDGCDGGVGGPRRGRRGARAEIAGDRRGGGTRSDSSHGRSARRRDAKPPLAPKGTCIGGRVLSPFFAGVEMDYARLSLLGDC
jgi:hypothetical protein